MAIQIKINRLDGKSAGNVDLSSENFGADFNESLIHQVVVAYLAGARSGTRAQKNRAAVRGGGAKPRQQKGSGRARVGTIRSPIFTGGGRTFPASNADFSQKVNKKMYRAAMRSILSELTRQERLVVVDDFSMDVPKTRSLIESLAKLEMHSGLLVVDEENSNVEKSARNLQSVEVIGSAQINPVDLIKHEKVLLTQHAAKKIDEALQ